MRLDEVKKDPGRGLEESGSSTLRLDEVSPEGQLLSSNIVRVERTERSLREEVELHGWEKKWEELDSRARLMMPTFSKSPAMATLHALANPVSLLLPKGTRNIVAEGGIVPFAKYLLPSEREIFEELDGGDKAKAIAWEGVGAALWALGPALKYAAGPAKKLAQWNTARKLLKIEPIEDAVSGILSKGGVWKGFDYNRALGKTLKGLRFSKEEVPVVADVLQGADPVALKAYAYEAKGVSNAWGKLIKAPESGKPYALPKLSRELVEKTEFGNLQAQHFSNLYRTNMQTIGKEAKLYHAENIMKEQVSRFYGAEAAERIGFHNMSEVEAANIITSMLSPRGKKIIGSVHKLAMGEFRLPWMHPERDVYGMGERVFGTKTRVFDKLAAAFTNSNKYTVEKMSTFMQMLEQRGFGKVVKGKHGIDFEPVKELWNKKNLDSAYELLKKIDNVAETGRKGKVFSKAEAQVLIEEMMNQAKADSPVVAELAGLVRDYHDVLYKDLLIGYIPKTVRRAGLTAKGEAIVGNLERLWLPKVEAAFRSNSGMTSGERVKLVKDMLKDFRRSLKNGDNYLASEKELEKVQEGLFGRLAYGSTKPGGIPAYLEHYTPRIAMRGASFEAKWKQALTGEASFMKHRRLSAAQESVPTLQEMLEARTRAQAKQMFFYDEVSDVVKYAKTLPESWQKHTDFTISRLLGKPSSWDEKLATVLQKVAPGNWDSYRAMRAAQKLTGLQYTGLLGLRPFSAFRNLTQPIIMTPAELGGGVRDMYSTLRGLALAGSKKHREYIRSIGAITEFVPDFARGPILPKTGFAQKWDSTRDAFMWMFRQSDRINRYWSGGAAVDKWEHALASVGGKVGDVGKFSRKLGLGGQEGWVKSEIESLLHMGRLDEAKASYVKNIIANTQYLYSILDAPAMTGLGGAQKIFTSFNSWWMNYGSALSRWVRTGEGTDKIKRMGSWLVSSLVAEQILEAWANRSTALRSTFLGPFPLGEYLAPPAIQPLIHVLRMVGEATTPDVAGDPKRRDRVVKEFLNSLKSAGTTFVPGGLQAKGSIRGYREDEWSGLAAAIVNYHKDEKYEPLFGLME